MSLDAIGQTLPEATEKGRNPIGAGLFWALKTIGVWLALLISTIVVTKLLPVGFPLPRQDGPFNFQQAWLLVNGIWAAAIALVAQRARVRGLRLVLLVWIAFFGSSSFMMVFEELYFNASLHMTMAQVFGLSGQFAVEALLVAAATALLFRPAAEDPAPLPSWMTARIVVLAGAYVFLYYAAGMFIAWQSAAVRAFYDNGAHIEPVSVLALQVLRGFLWALIALFVVTRLKGSLASRAAVMAVMFAALADAQLLFPNPMVPWAVRHVHLVEVGTSEAVYGIVATFVLLAGAARRPLSATNPWRLIAERG